MMSLKVKLMLLLTILTLAPMAILECVTLIVATGYIKEIRTEGLESIADLKAKNIERFFSERKSDALLAAGHPHVIELLNQAGENALVPDMPSRSRDIKSELSFYFDSQQINYRYLQVMLVDSAGEDLYGQGGSEKSDLIDEVRISKSLEYLRRRSGDVYYSDIGRNPDGGGHNILVSAPVISDDGELLGAVIYAVDMDPIYGLITESEGLGATGETLLVKDMGEFALFLNPLRHDPDAALSRKALYGRPQAVPAQESARGGKGNGQSVDYRDKAIIASWRHIPALDWGLIAKIDKEEAFAPAHTLIITGLIIGGMTLLLGIAAAAKGADSITAPIEKMKESARIIAGGNLDHRVGIDADNEIGGTESLLRQNGRKPGKRAWASRDELNRQIEANELIKEALLESEKMHRSLVETTSDWVWEVDRRGRYSYSNPKAKDILGYEPGELLDMSPYDLMPESEVERVKPLLTELIKANQPFPSIECVHVRKDGTHAVMEIRGEPFFDAEGNLMGHRGINRDVTKRKTAEKSLRETEERYRALFERSMDGMYLADLQGNFIEANPAALNMLGVRAGRNPPTQLRLAHIGRSTGNGNGRSG